MRKRRTLILMPLLLVLAAALVVVGLGITARSDAAAQTTTTMSMSPGQDMPRMNSVTAAQRKAAADRAAVERAKSTGASALAVPTPGGLPDYFGVYPNWANSPQAVLMVPTVTLTGGGGTGAIATAEVRGVTLITVTAGGSGYTFAPTVVISGVSGSGATATAVLTAGVVTGVTITDGGTGYMAAPSVSFVGGGGIGATATATVAPAGPVTGVVVMSGGSGYTSAPAVGISAPGAGTTATATATVSGGVVTSIAVNVAGTGYGDYKRTVTNAIFGIRKFVDTLPGLGATNTGVGTGQNDLLQYIPVAVADKTTYTGSDYYEIALVQYKEQLHADLPVTTLRGYVQIWTPALAAANPGLGKVALTYPNATPILDNQGQQVYGVTTPQYLGPIITATSYDPTKPAGVAGNGQPTRVKFTNYLPTGSGGNLFIPMDSTIMGAGMGPSSTWSPASRSPTGAPVTRSPPMSLSPVAEARVLRPKPRS
jgi:hypothetical protein